MKMKRNFSHRGNRKTKEAMLIKTVNRKQNHEGTQKKRKDS
jgi:hypothetical protein